MLLTLPLERTPLHAHYFKIIAPVKIERKNDILVLVEN